MIESTPRIATAREVAAELRRRSAFVMVSHVKPDGDTLGAGLALGIALKSSASASHISSRTAFRATCVFCPMRSWSRAELRPDLPPERCTFSAT